MLKDRFDMILAGALLTTLLITAVLLVVDSGSSGSSHASTINHQMERELLYQAKVAFLERHYGPVVSLRDDGSLQEALLKLEELSRNLPGEAHTDLLTGDIMLRMGQFDLALTKLASAVRKNAEYVDHASPLSQRPLVESAVSSALPLMRDRLRSQPDSRNLAQVVKDGYYLQSRLAGGCE